VKVSVDCQATTIIDPIGDLHQLLALELVGESREIHCVASLRELHGDIGQSTRLAICPAELLEFLAPRIDALLPNGRLIVWATKVQRRAYELAASLEQVASIIAWPVENQLPRSWELSMAARRLIAGPAASFEPESIASDGASRRKWLLCSTDDISEKTDELVDLVRGTGASRRLATRVAGVAHEMFMNAVYDAPVDERGQPIYAYDRTATVRLPETDGAKVAVVSDAEGLFLQVADRFGGLRRRHVFASIERGFRSSDKDASPGDFIDSSHGGAGLGIHRILMGASACVFDVVEGEHTVQTAYFDLTQRNRDARRAPRSLHFFSEPGERARSQ